MKQYVFKRQHTQSTNITATAIDAISVPVMDSINSTLIDLNGQYNMVKEEFDIHVRRELVYSRSNYPDLFEMIIDGVDRTTLEDALTKFELYKQGKITAEMAVRNGVSLTRTQYKVPNDFFNEEAIRDYYKDL